MYAIRVDEQRKLLRVDLSGRMSTTEALRAISQAGVLAEASSICAVLCDATGVDRGPETLHVVAAALHARRGSGMRIALVCTPVQSGVAERLARSAGLRKVLATFGTAAEAETWLAPLLTGAPNRTAREEAEALLGRPLLVERARRMSTQVPPAA